MSDSGGNGGMPTCIEGADVLVTPANHMAHLLLHCEPHEAPPMAKHLGLSLPDTPLSVGRARGWAALHLAPDEWLLIGPQEEADAMTEAFDEAAIQWPHSLVDISDRGLAFDVEGSGAERLLASGCPLDLAPASFPVDRCTRTVLGKAMVMIWRTGTRRFRLEVARSFAPYVVKLLSTAARERD